MLLASGGTAAARDLVTGNDYAPFTDENLPQGGMLTEIVVRAFAETGMTPPVQFVPWKRGYDATVAGHYLATFPYVRTPEREREVLYSDPLIAVRQLLFFHPPSRVAFRTVDNLRGLRLCAPIGWAPPPAIQFLIDGGAMERDSPRDLSACARMTASGRTQVFIVDEYTGRSTIVEAGLENNIAIAQEPFASETLHLIISRRLPDAAELVARFNAGLAKLAASGARDGIIRRHEAVALR